MLQASYIILEDLDSLKSSLKAATIKNHKPLLYLSENTKEGEIPQVSYHGKCNNFLPWSEINWKTFLKQRMQNSFLIWKAKRKAELTRMCALFAKRRLHIKRYKKTRSFDSVGWILFRCLDQKSCHCCGWYQDYWPWRKTEISRTNITVRIENFANNVELIQIKPMWDEIAH